jgi:hypothetical protein
MNVVRPEALKMFADADIDWLVHTIKLVFIDATYVYDEAHDFLADVAAPDRVYTHTLTGKTSTDGICAAATDIVAMPAGNEITQAWVYRDTGSDATSPLIAYYDTDDARQPRAFPPNGGDVAITIPPVEGLFSL